MWLPYQSLIAAFAAAGSVAYGYSASIIAFTIGQQSFYDYMGLARESSHTDSIIGAANGLFSAGFLGAAFTGWSAQEIGRLRSMQVGCAISILGSALMAGAANVAMFLASRLINGFAIGMLVTLVPLYNSEVSSAEKRGRLVGLHGVFLASAYVTAGLVSYATTFAPYGHFQWRFPLAVQIIPVALLLVCSPWMPFSPRWLLSKGRDEEARKTVEKLHSRTKKAREDPGFIEREFTEMQRQIAAEKAKGVITSLGQARLAFQKPSFRKRLWLGILCPIGNQCTGNLVVNNYQVILYNGLGITGSTPILLTACWNIVGIMGNSFTSLFVDRWGRRPYIIVGSAGCAACLCILAALTHHYVDIDPTNIAGQRAAVFMIFLYVAFYAGGLDATGYIVPAEIAPMEIRAFLMSWSLSGQWLSSLIFLSVGPTALSNIGYKFYFVFIILSAIYCVLVYMYLPETANLTLEQMAALFGDQGDVAFRDVEDPPQKDPGVANKV